MAPFWHNSRQELLNGHCSNTWFVGRQNKGADGAGRNKKPNCVEEISKSNPAKEYKKLNFDIFQKHLILHEPEIATPLQEKTEKVLNFNATMHRNKSQTSTHDNDPPATMD